MTPMEMIGAIHEAVDEDNYELTEWEEEFLESIDGAEEGNLSPKQQNVLERIYKKATKESEG